MIFQHSIPAYHTKSWNIAFTNYWRKRTRLDEKASLSLTNSVHFGQMRRSVIDIIFHVEIFAVLLIFLSIISSSVLEVKYLDKLLVFLWVRTAHRC